MNDQFIIENLQYVFGIDALETSRPINIEVNTPAEINSMFDAISYEKGFAETSINAFTPSGLKNNLKKCYRLLRHQDVRRFNRTGNVPAWIDTLSQRQVNVSIDKKMLIFMIASNNRLWLRQCVWQCRSRQPVGCPSNSGGFRKCNPPCDGQGDHGHLDLQNGLPICNCDPQLPNGRRCRDSGLI